MEMRYVQYQCSGPKCGATDEVKLFPNERTPMAINCHKCKNGLKMELKTMIEHRIGMFPVSES